MLVYSSSESVSQRKVARFMSSDIEEIRKPNFLYQLT